MLKELLRYEGVAVASTGSPREILKAAYRFYPCMDENIWLGMLAQRNNMAHMYDGAAAAEFNSTGPDNPKNPEKLLTTDVLSIEICSSPEVRSFFHHRARLVGES